MYPIDLCILDLYATLLDKGLGQLTEESKINYEKKKRDKRIKQEKKKLCKTVESNLPNNLPGYHGCLPLN